MARGLRSFAVLAGVLTAGIHCGSANAQAPAVSPADVPPSPPPAAVVPAPALTGPVIVSGPGPRIHLERARHYPYPVATLPGFEVLPDGGSRLFVEVTRAVNVEERRTPRVLTYVLKGTRVVYRNNENSLVTVHFNTPVTRARLVPAGGDLLFSVDLRADAAPAWKMINESDGTATLQVDFPSGSYLPAGEIADVSYGGPRPASVPPAPADGPAVVSKPARRPGARPAPPPAAPPGGVQPSPN